MASFNRVIIIGNLTRDPELRYIPSGTAVSEITLAVNDRRKGPKGDWVEETSFIDVTLWGRTAEIASEYLNKGSPLFVEGRLKQDTWEKEGKKHSKLKIVCEKMQLIGSKGGPGGGGGAPRGGGASRGAPPQHDESEASFGGGDYYDEAPAPAAETGRRGGSGGGGGAPQEDDIPF